MAHVRVRTQVVAAHPYRDKEVTVVPVTTTIRDIPSEVLLSPREGMPRDRTINLDRIQTVSKGRVGAWMTTLSDEKMVQRRQALLFALGFDDDS